MADSAAIEQTDPGHPDEWHAAAIDAVFETVNTDATGLSSTEAEHRLAQFGPNEIQEGEQVAWYRIFFRQYQSVLIWILVIAAVVMAGVGHTIDAGVILGIVVFITIFGFVQDYRAEQSIAALKKLATRHAIVRRDGHKTELETTALVPGDVIFVESGDVVPADARIFEESNLSVDESALTGESLPVSKSTEPVSVAAPLADRTNALYKDTVVERGSGVAVVVATGDATEIGGIATALEAAEERATPFETEMDRLAKVIAIAVITAVGLIIVAELVVGDTPLLQVFLTAVGIAVSAVPEGLPAVVTLSLALGARRMAAENALVRRLPVVEALGSVDVICTDKTGTLTEEEMTVQRLVVGDTTFTASGTGYDLAGEFVPEAGQADAELDRLMLCTLLCNNVDVGRPTNDGDQRYIGDPTEIALFVAARKWGLDPEPTREEYPRVDEIEFTSARKRMTSVHTSPGGEHVAFMKGAPETVLERCTHERRNGDVVELTDDRVAELSAVTEAFASDALRVMGFAERRPLEARDSFTDDIEHDMTFLGLQGMLDPPRPEVEAAIGGCLAAGINVIMITGDNATTASAVAKQIGLESPSVVTGPDLQTIDDQELATLVEEVTIFARTAPDHKTRILQALQQRGHTVAMTGDGVNDAPAVKNADVGVAMGMRGTDVTEQASDMVLLDDNFATIHHAVREGRRIFDNVRKFVNFLLCWNAGEVVLVFSGSMVGLGLVIAPVQILWINVVTNGIPALSLGVDPATDDIMEREPRAPDEGVITDRILVSIVGVGLLIAITILPLYYIHRADTVLARTMVFTALVVFEIAGIQAVRRRYGLGTLSNQWFILGVTIAFVLQLIVLYTPVGILFDVVPLGLIHWAQIGIGLVVFSVLLALFEKVLNQYFDRY